MAAAANCEIPGPRSAFTSGLDMDCWSDIRLGFFIDSLYDRMTQRGLGTVSIQMLREARQEQKRREGARRQALEETGLVVTEEGPTGLMAQAPTLENGGLGNGVKRRRLNSRQQRELAKLEIDMKD